MTSVSDGGGRELTLADLDEEEILARILPGLPPQPQVVLGPGDDTAVLAAPTGQVLVTTDSMVRDRDWRDDWSTGQDVGVKAVAMNVADIAAMGAVCTGIVVALVADPATPVRFIEDLNAGIAEECRAAGVAVLGGDLSSAPEGTRVVAITALGELRGVAPVLRSGARVGDVVAVSDRLGRSHAGLLLLQQGRRFDAPELVRFHVSPRPAYAQGPRAAAAGAHAMLDISDGLVRDARRIATASGVRIALESELLEPQVRLLAPAVGEHDGWECVLSGGEEHTLLATFAADADLPPGWQRIGTVRDGQGVTLDGTTQHAGGWDHFAPGKD